MKKQQKDKRKRAISVDAEPLANYSPDDGEAKFIALTSEQADIPEGRVLLAASLGAQPTGGGGLSITRVETAKSTVRVHLRVNEPAETAFATQAFATPCAAVSCDRAALPENALVEFVNQRGETIGTCRL